MHPRERLLEMGKLYLNRGEPIPVDVLAEAEEWGILLSDFDQPDNNISHQGDDNYGSNIKETDIHDL